MAEVSKLIEQGLIEVVRKDEATAYVLLDEATRHIASGSTIAASDPDGAYALLWDATRKAIVSHMLFSGFRSKSDRPGAHRAVVLYAEAAIADHLGAHVDHFDRMRRTRNRSEYGPRTITEAEVIADLTHVRALVR